MSKYTKVLSSGLAIACGIGVSSNLAALPSGYAYAWKSAGSGSWIIADGNAYAGCSDAEDYYSIAAWAIELFNGNQVDIDGTWTLIEGYCPAYPSGEITGPWSEPGSGQHCAAAFSLRYPHSGPMETIDEDEPGMNPGVGENNCIYEDFS